MSAPIIPGLSFHPNQSFLPHAGQLFLITDHLASPGDFILHRTLVTHLKEGKDGRAIIVSFASDFAHWRVIATKSNVNLSQHLASNALVFIDGLALSAYSIPSSNSQLHGYVTSPPILNTEDVSLRALYDLITRSLCEPSSKKDADGASPKSVIIDDITLLELVGVPTIEVTRFIRALRASCISHSARLIIRAHASAVSDTGISVDSDLLQFLMNSCHVHAEVRPLASGRSGAVSGEIAIHKGGLSQDDEIASRGRTVAMQYRLSDGGAIFFHKGMGAGVL